MERVNLHDPFGRKINYLRLSVTDRCNLRCTYCMPETGIQKVNHADLLTYEELYRIASAAVSIGIEKIRITGGEPLVRADLPAFIRRLSFIPGLKQLVLTTNGHHLERLAGDLYEAGIRRVNISLDSLDRESYRSITRGGDLDSVYKGIAAAEQASMQVKINMVVMKGVNDHEIVNFAKLAIEKSIMVRFIEYMPAIRAQNWQGLVLSGDEILARVAEIYELVPCLKEEMVGPARNFMINGSEGGVGVITPVSDHFCNECNRIRIASTGEARGCLFSGGSVNLKKILDTGDEGLLLSAMQEIVGSKSKSHLMSREYSLHAPFSMSSIGG